MTDALFDTQTLGLPHALGGSPGTHAGLAGGEVAAPAVTPAGPVLEVIGLDLALKRTGIASHAGAESLITPDALRGFPRMRWVRAAVLERVADADLVVVERPAYSRNEAFAKEVAGLWHLVMCAVDQRGTRWIDVASSTRQKYATGNGRADKGEVLAAAIKRLPIDVANHDEADAAWLCAIGHELLGQPLAELPATHRTAMTAVRANYVLLESA